MPKNICVYGPVSFKCRDVVLTSIFGSTLVFQAFLFNGSLTKRHSFKSSHIFKHLNMILRSILYSFPFLYHTYMLAKKIQPDLCLFPSFFSGPPRRPPTNVKKPREIICVQSVNGSGPLMIYEILLTSSSKGMKPQYTKHSQGGRQQSINLSTHDSMHG